MRMIPCKCSCGTLIPEFDDRGRKREYVNGHQNRRRIFSDEHRKNLSEAHIGIIPSDATRQLISDANMERFVGEKNPNWQGGISKFPYCSIWTKWLKGQIKERDNRQCKNPDCNEKSSTLCVHHIDYDKKNCSVDNLITLCKSCNNKANFNREYWKEFYNKIIKNNINDRGLKND